MRIRVHDSSLGANATPCGTSTYGEVEDYTVTICPVYEPVGTPVDNCVAQTFDVSVSVPGLGDGVGTILYTVDGGTLQSAPYVSPSTSLTGFSVGQIVDATLDVGGCTYSIGSIESACVQELDCEATEPVVKTHCYQNGDTKTWWFSTDGPTIELKFTAGELLAGDQIEIVDGDPTDPFANLETTFIEGDLTNQVWTSYTNQMGIRFATDGSGSCSENGLTPIEFQVRCSGCSEPSGEVILPLEANCATNTFNVSVFLTDPGLIDPSTPATEIGVSYTVNGGLPIPVSGGPFAASDIVNVGNFPLGSTVNVILVHESSSVCNNTIATGLTLAANCPPINDLCTSPTSLTVQANCTGNGVSGTTENATSTETPSCDSDGPWYDVWYIFNSGDFISHNINFTPGTIEDWGFELFTTCGAPVVDGCGGFGGTNLILPTLAANTNYRLKVFTNDAFGAPGDFQICISGTPLTPGERCDNAIAIGVAPNAGACSPTTVTSGVQQNGPNGCSVGAEDDRWFSFVAPNNGNKLVLSTTAGTATDWVMQVWTGCPGTGTLIDCNDDQIVGVQPMPRIELCQFDYTPGATYYVRLWTYGTFSTGNCTLCVYEDTPCPAPPANNACVNAQALSMNAAADCPANSSAGTTISATPAANGVPTCDLFSALNDVWYTVTTGSSQTTLRVDLSNVSGNHEAAVYSNFTCGTNGAGATQVACFTAGGTQNVTVLPSTVYHIRVWANPGNQGDFNICVSAPAFTCTTDLSIDWVVPGLSSTPLWELRDASNNFLVASGGGQSVITGGIYPEVTCVPDGDFRFLVLNGSSMRYVLRTAGNPGTRLIDNQSPVSGAHSVAEFSTSPAALSSSGPIQNPVGPTELLFTSCDKYFWKKGEFVVVNEDPDVAAVWIPGAGTNQSSTTGYDFWFYDPNGTYSFIRQRRHNVTDGFGNVGSARTCHMQVNNWATANWIPNQLPLNVRVRAVVENVPKNWGPACRFVRDDALANCTPTWLMDVPGNPFISCNTIRAFNNQSINRVYARPVSGATKYEFTFNTAEGPIVREVTTYYVTLGWNASVAPPLVDGAVYDVTVRAFKGGVYCPAGKVCTVQICNTPASCTNDLSGGSQNSAIDAVTGAALNMWPNPNRGDQ
ncbi:MAG: hypothetical protein KDB84_03940, partial [Flavobacteriales bacterium]|nr:hypothetical protein [Flavobacteriales bacterium]